MPAPDRLARRIRDASADGRQRTRPVALGAIDGTRPFTPARWTQLYYTPLWADLEPRHRLRYTQLYGLRTNEMIMLFERVLAQRVLPRIARLAALASQPTLRDLVLDMAREEREHDAMFAELNRRSRPDLYRDRDFVFFPPSLEARALVAVMAWSSRWLAHPVWLLLFVEEGSLALARDLARMGERDALGAAESHWLAVHVEHTRDERRHTLIDRLLFDACYADRGPWARRLDGRLFPNLLRAMLLPRPRGAGMRVAARLIDEFPELEPLRVPMRRAIVALGHDPRFLESLLSRRLVPRTWKLLRRCPELAGLADWIPGYD